MCVSKKSSPFSAGRNNSVDDYFDACTRAEITAPLDEARHRTVVALLDYDANGGRRLLTAPGFCGLAAGDRLEPSASIPDIGQAFDVQSTPLVATFWRTSRESLCRHRNPLFGKDLHILPSVSLVVDTLHALYLGVMHVFLRVSIWALVLSGFWGGAAAGNRVYMTGLIFVNTIIKKSPSIYAGK